jgi:uncharacterized protein (UPF0548 family)
VISPVRPSPAAIQRAHAEAEAAAPTYRSSSPPPERFRTEHFSEIIGNGQPHFDRARAGIEQWAAHRGSGIEVFPPDAEVEVGQTVTLLIRQLGLWVVASCRVESVVEEAERFGFSYVTMPGHPECGVETFVIRYAPLGRDSRVHFDIEATSRPLDPLVRLVSPIGRAIQRRATRAYIAALRDWTTGQHQ